MKFTHVELFRLKQAQEILTRVLKQAYLPSITERELIEALKSLSLLLDSIKVKQDTMRK